MKFRDLRRFIDQISAWHAWLQLQREAVPGSVIDHRPQEPRRPWRRRVMLAIALAGPLGAGGVFAASHIWSETLDEKLPAPVIERTDIGTRAPQRATPETRVPQTRPQPQGTARPQTQVLALPRAPKPTQPQNQPPRTRKQHNQVRPAYKAPSTEPPVPAYLDKPTVRLHVQRTLDKIKSCYATRLAIDPTLAGTVQTHFVILPSGSVTASIARGLDSELEGCITNILDDIKFPRSRNSVGVTYPFQFVANEEPGHGSRARASR